MEPADDAGMSEDEVDVEVRHWHPPSIRIPVPNSPQHSETPTALTT